MPAILDYRCHFNYILTVIVFDIGSQESVPYPWSFSSQNKIRNVCRQSLITPSFDPIQQLIQNYTERVNVAFEVLCRAMDIC